MKPEEYTYYKDHAWIIRTKDHVNFEEYCLWEVSPYCYKWTKCLDVYKEPITRKKWIKLTKEEAFLEML